MIFYTKICFWMTIITKRRISKNINQATWSTSFVVFGFHWIDRIQNPRSFEFNWCIEFNLVLSDVKCILGSFVGCNSFINILKKTWTTINIYIYIIHEASYRAPALDFEQCEPLVQNSTYFALRGRTRRLLNEMRVNARSDVQLNELLNLGIPQQQILRWLTFINW